MKKLSTGGSFRNWTLNLEQLFADTVHISLNGVNFSSKQQFHTEYFKVIDAYEMKRSRAMIVTAPIINEENRMCGIHYVEAVTMGRTHCLVMKENLANVKWNENGQIVEWHETSNPEWIQQTMKCLKHQKNAEKKGEKKKQ